MPLYGQNFCTWTSEGLSLLALSLLPVTIKKSISAFQAVFVHLLSSKGQRFLSLDEIESISLNKILLFTFAAIGVILLFI
jgi:hypothetical protein